MAKKGCTSWKKGLTKESDPRIKSFPAWNKGLTKETDSRVADMANKIKGHIIPWNKGLTKENDPRIASYANNKIGKRRLDMIGDNNPSRRPDIHASKFGKGNPNWNGGCSTVYCEKWTAEFRERIRSYFNHECIVCGKSQEENNRKLCCHHVYYNKDACCNGMDDEWKFATLCNSCHAKTGIKKDRIRWQYILNYIIYEIYNNKTYYTKEEYVKIIIY